MIDERLALDFDPHLTVYKGEISTKGESSIGQQGFVGNRS